ncbi:hypothetical protein BC567DRAFT_215132 [Phyllosticta citribraziliensis]
MFVCLSCLIFARRCNPARLQSHEDMPRNGLNVEKVVSSNDSVSPAESHEGFLSSSFRARSIFRKLPVRSIQKHECFLYFGL